MIGPGTVFATHGHTFDDVAMTMREQPTLYESIVVENDVWIGSGVILLPGVRIGRGSIIGAGAVVSRDIPPYSLAVGVPARVIKNRNQALDTSDLRQLIVD